MTRAAARAILHELDPVGAGNEIPQLQQDRVSRRLQLPGAPLRPGPVRLLIGHEEIPFGQVALAEHHGLRGPQRGVLQARVERFQVLPRPLSPRTAASRSLALAGLTTARKTE
jgi:hypothetical protein